MSDSDKLVLPAGVQFKDKPSGLFIEYEGDVEIRGLPDQVLAGVASTGGAVTLLGEVKVSFVSAATVLRIEGSVTADVLLGRDIEVTGGFLQAKAVKGSRSATVGPARVELDVLMAPQIVVSPEATGQVAVLESEQPVAPNALKGGFSLEEFARVTGKDPDRYLADRGLFLSTSSGRQQARESPPGPSAPADPPAAPPLERDPVHISLMEHVDQIISYYDPDYLPEPVARLRQLVIQGDYQSVHEEITNLWNQLMRFHQKQELRIEHQVTTTFNTIHAIVQKMELA